MDVCADVGPEKKRVLHGVTGAPQPGQVLAVMGPTGSGKTTFLHVVSNRLQASQGWVAYGGKRWHKDLRRRIAYVEQDDEVFAQLTVRETLTYAALLRIDWSVPREDKLARVEEVIRMLHLEKCADTRVGDSDERGVSGGERKRLCIAEEFITFPDILICDEPTSGLDSSTALRVVECMQELARENGTTVITSLHQPSSHIFALFDSLLMLSDGRPVYNGPAGETSVEFFRKHGHACPEHWNPPDFFMDLVVNGLLDVPLLSREIESQAREKCAHLEQPQPQLKNTSVGGRSRSRSRSRGRGLFSITSSSSGTMTSSMDRSNSLGNDSSGGSSSSSSGSGGSSLRVSDRYAAPWRMQLWILGSRSLRVASAYLTWENAIMFFLLAIIVALLWWDLPATEAGIFPRFAMAFWLVGTWSFFPLFNALPLLKSHRVLLRREHKVGAFRLSAYYVARTCIQIPIEAVFLLGYVPIVFWFVRPNYSVVAFLILTLILLLNMVMMQSIGTLISASVPDHRLMTVCIIIITWMFAYANLFMPLEDLPIWLQWISYINRKCLWVGGVGGRGKEGGRGGEFSFYFWKII